MKLGVVLRFFLFFDERESQVFNTTCIYYYYNDCNFFGHECPKIDSIFVSKVLSFGKM